MVAQVLERSGRSCKCMCDGNGTFSLLLHSHTLVYVVFYSRTLGDTLKYVVCHQRPSHAATINRSNYNRSSISYSDSNSSSRFRHVTIILDVHPLGPLLVFGEQTAKPATSPRNHCRCFSRPNEMFS